VIKQYWNIRHIRNGEVIWQEEYKHNAIADEGAEAILEVFYRASTAYAPATFYVRLCDDTLVVSDTLSSVQNEPSGNGYAAQEVTRDTTGFPMKDVASNGNQRLTSKTVTFTASGGSIGPVTTAYIATTSDNTGKLIGYLPLSMQRTVLNGDAMEYEFFAEEGNS
jgi:hypothetical protein